MYYKLNKKHSIIIGLIYVVLSVYIFPFFLITSSGIGEGINQTKIHPNYYKNYLDESKNNFQKGTNNQLSKKLTSNIQDREIKKSMEVIEKLWKAFLYIPNIFFIFGVLLFLVKNIYIVTFPFFYCIVFTIISKYVEHGYFFYLLSNQFEDENSFIDIMKDIWVCFWEDKQLIMYFFGPSPIRKFINLIKDKVVGNRSLELLFLTNKLLDRRRLK